MPLGFIGAEVDEGTYIHDWLSETVAFQGRFQVNQYPTFQKEPMTQNNAS